VDVLVLSLGPPTTTFDPEDPLQLATRHAYEQNLAVVVAAGNFGPGKLQSLARAPWVISVGAVDENKHLYPESGTGANEGEGPTVVGYGKTWQSDNSDPTWETFEHGTSFAAPKVAGVAAFTRVLLRTIIADLTEQQAGQWSALSNSIKAPIVGIADTGVDPKQLPSIPSLAQWSIEQGNDGFLISRADTERQWYAAMVDALSTAGTTCTLTDSPDSVKRALQLMARKLDGYTPREVGAGLVSINEALTFFSNLTPERWLGIFCPDAIQSLGKTRLAELNTTLGPLWDDNKVFALRTALFDGIRLFVLKII
jgi:hypothetical protein